MENEKNRNSDSFIIHLGLFLSSPGHDGWLVHGADLVSPAGPCLSVGEEEEVAEVEVDGEASSLQSPRPARTTLASLISSSPLHIP